MCSIGRYSDGGSSGCLCIQGRFVVCISLYPHLEVVG